MNFELEGIIKTFDEWVEYGICPDCGGDLDENGECPGWYDQNPLPRYNLMKIADNSKPL